MMADTADNSVMPSLNNSMEDTNQMMQEQQQQPPLDQMMNPMVGTDSMESNPDQYQQQQQMMPPQNDDSLILDNNNNNAGDSMTDMPIANNNPLAMNDSMDDTAGDNVGAARDIGNNDSMDIITDRNNNNNPDSPTNEVRGQPGEIGSEPPPVELLADDAAQCKYQAKVAEEGLEQMKRTAVPLAMAFQEYALTIGELRDGGDNVTQRLIQLAELCSYNTTVRSGMVNCTRWLACLLDHANVRAYRIQDNVAVPLINKFNQHFRIMKQELKATRAALSREDAQFKRMTQQHQYQHRHRQSRAASLDYQKTYSNYENARRDRREVGGRLEQSLQRLRTNRLSDVRQALRNFCHTELHYHCKAIETLTEAFQQVKAMDVEKDQQEFRKALNIAGVMNKPAYDYGEKRRGGESPVRTRSGVRARIREARSRYMMRNQPGASSRPQRSSAPRPQYDVNIPPGLMVPNYRNNAKQITANQVARELHRVDTMIDQNQIRQSQQRYEPKPQKPFVPPMQRQDFYNEQTSSSQQQRRNIYQPPPPLQMPTYDQSEVLRPRRAPMSRATSAPPPGGMARGGGPPGYGNMVNNGRQKPYEDDAMFDYLNKRLQAERKRYDHEWEARNRFENEQFSSMKQLPPYRAAATAAEETYQQTNAATAAMLASENPFNTQQPNFMNEPPPPMPPMRRQQQQQQQQQYGTRARAQQRSGPSSGGNRRAPATRETKTSFHVTDYDHGPVTIFPTSMPPEIDYSRTHDTTSFHSNDIQNPRMMPFPPQQQQQRDQGMMNNNNRQRRFSGGNESLGGGGARGPIVYRNPEPDHLPGARQQQSSRPNRPMSAGANPSSRQQQQMIYQDQQIYRPLGYSNNMNDDFNAYY